MLSAHHEGKVLKRKLFTVWICKLPTNIWEASGFLFCLWDKYSGTLPSSVIIQLLVLLNAIKIVLYQWPHAVCDCSFSFNFFSGEVVVAMVIVINFVIGGFCWVNLIWLTASTVQLQVPDNNQLSDYIVRLQLYRMNSEKKSRKCINHIWGNCYGSDHCQYKKKWSKFGMSYLKHSDLSFYCIFRNSRWFRNFLTRELRACARTSYRYDVGNGIRSLARSIGRFL